uniref:GK20468 n=1 Tax=Drosophila willistoni TaxID=7260 RepID=B4N4Y2_DROWI
MATTGTTAHPDDASSMSDDVFEDAETTQARIEELRRRPFGDGCYNPTPPPAAAATTTYAYASSATITASSTSTNTNTTTTTMSTTTTTTTSTTPFTQKHHHPHHQHQTSQLSLTSSHHYHDDSLMAPVQKSAVSGYPGYRPSREALQMYAYGSEEYDYEDDYDDGWRSYRYDEVDMHQPPPFDDTVNHKTILLGDSGVGKTSFLVKYNTGEFRLGSFSATVGIALTRNVDDEGDDRDDVDDDEDVDDDDNDDEEDVVVN